MLFLLPWGLSEFNPVKQTRATSALRPLGVKMKDIFARCCTTFIVYYVSGIVLDHVDAEVSKH